MNEPDTTYWRFERRFRAIEAEVPERPFAVRPPRQGPRARLQAPSLLAGATVVLLAVLVLVPMAQRSPAPAAAPPSATAAATIAPTGSPLSSTAPSPTPRLVTTGRLTWTAACRSTSDADCDGAVGLFSNNLARSWQWVHKDSGGQLTVEPRACPTTAGGLTARSCWDVTAAVPNGPICMVVANGANDPRYPAYFQIGGDDETGQIAVPGAPPRPMCLATP
jgi:hypothetical protein